MSANKKKNLTAAEADSSSEDEDVKNDEEEEDEDMESDDSDGMDSDSFQENEELQIEFEGRTPVDPDAEGISQLLKRLLPCAQINCNQLAELLIAQNFVGSVICQCMDDDLDSEMEDMVEEGTIFGITSVVNLTAKKDKPVIEQLRKYITQRAEMSATKQVQEQLKNLLDNEQRHVGLLINERFINIPAQISVPLLQNLHEEIEAAKAKKMKFNFDTLLMLVKFHRKLGKKGKPDEDQFVNAEEELLAERSKFSFEFPLSVENDSLDDGPLRPYRKLLALEAKQLPQLINEIETYIKEE
ncbi:hypothetical protein AWZ03_005365 [Drosophila navojoa]|uniref:Protein BCCIP homolog n=1 Tax=Drosophila navojoa TaxID=7232 RepID=A0A484BJG1_DRONA|nr:protein BCCIP homolog [Drosophila navojoa]TDG48190.1 hypothetical protein AWZ03_005365 [Drosophila navojoa]